MKADEFMTLIFNLLRLGYKQSSLQVSSIFMFTDKNAFLNPRDARSREGILLVLLAGEQFYYTSSAKISLLGLHIKVIFSFVFSVALELSFIPRID